MAHTETKTGRILKGVGGFYYVDVADALYECRARGKFRLEKQTPTVGDIVDFEVVAANEGYLHAIHERKNSFVRPPVSNLDVLVVTASTAPPVTDPYLIDRLLAVAVCKGITPVLALNKSDVRPADELFQIYTEAGFSCVKVSALTGEGGDELRSILTGKLCAFAGNSGVGKSSLLNALYPGLQLATGALNDKIGRGRHTTRHVEILKLDGGTLLADTPGFSSYEITPADAMQKEELCRCFPEFSPYLGECRFADCAHTGEDGCAVAAAKEAGKISGQRYTSYVRLYEKLAEYLPWETGK
ncbi:ribosome small subunit-dependent GTPase A [Oscillospiraceae bacterium OttesenSCG-928-G22]|nr:ribosome small subunit-dependent GTPase A [Oscillospiraceae bacterium OttesenSCG-928-G22]